MGTKNAGSEAYAEIKELSKSKFGCFKDAIVAPANDKKQVKGYKTTVTRLSRAYDCYETTRIIDGEKWLMACFYGELRHSYINYLVMMVGYHFITLELTKQDFFRALRNNIPLIATFLFALIPYLFNYIFLGKETIAYILGTGYDTWELMYFIPLVVGLFYWPLGIVTGYVALYLTFF